MIEYYKDKRRDKVIPYVVFQAQEEDTVITMYESGKVMFQGVSADVDAAMWGVQLENTKEKKAENKKLSRDARINACRDIRPRIIIKRKMRKTAQSCAVFA